ncbi:MAG TPA: hypothetical protein VL490_06015 [Mucilaginibacter sp.]|jgi:hypothetical protein|nr:hypothetical protein [Mucilaginibacter sp.]
MRKLLPLIFLFLCSCVHVNDANYQELQDTIQKLKKKTDFQPLDSAHAYDFINKYYLPLMDTLLSGRKLLLYPINGEDFTAIFKDDVIKLTAEYNKDTATINKRSKMYPPPPLGVLFDRYHPWNENKLSNITLIADTQIYYSRADWDKINLWDKKYAGHGYVGISYPLYNKYTNRLYLREYVIRSVGGIDENHFENNLWFKKIPKGWKMLYNHRTIR